MAEVAVMAISGVEMRLLLSSQATVDWVAGCDVPVEACAAADVDIVRQVAAVAAMLMTLLWSFIPARLAHSPRRWGVVMAAVAIVIVAWAVMAIVEMAVVRALSVSVELMEGGMGGCGGVDGGDGGVDGGGGGG